MILDPQSKLQKHEFPAEKKSTFLQSSTLSCTFLQKNVAFEGHIQETAGNCRRVSGLKNQEHQPTFTRVMILRRMVLDFFHTASVLTICQKNPRAHKNKIGIPPQKNPKCPHP